MRKLFLMLCVASIALVSCGKDKEPESGPGSGSGQETLTGIPLAIKLFNSASVDDAREILSRSVYTYTRTAKYENEESSEFYACQSDTMSIDTKSGKMSGVTFEHTSVDNKVKVEGGAMLKELGEHPVIRGQELSFDNKNRVKYEQTELNNINSYAEFVAAVDKDSVRSYDAGYEKSGLDIGIGLFSGYYQSDNKTSSMCMIVE